MGGNPLGSTIQAERRVICNLRGQRIFLSRLSRLRLDRIRSRIFIRRSKSSKPAPKLSITIPPRCPLRIAPDQGLVPYHPVHATAESQTQSFILSIHQWTRDLPLLVGCRFSVLFLFLLCMCLLVDHGLKLIELSPHFVQLLLIFRNASFVICNLRQSLR